MRNNSGTSLPSFVRTIPNRRNSNNLQMTSSLRPKVTESHYQFSCCKYLFQQNHLGECTKILDEVIPVISDPREAGPRIMEFPGKVEFTKEIKCIVCQDELTKSTLGYAEITPCGYKLCWNRQDKACFQVVQNWINWQPCIICQPTAPFDQKHPACMIIHTFKPEDSNMVSK